jgi:hypothetical protein
LATAKPSPLDVLLRTMHRHFEAEEYDEAAAAAKAAAPYVHPRPSAARALPDLSAVKDDELDDLCARSALGTDSQTVDPK